MRWSSPGFSCRYRSVQEEFSDDRGVVLTNFVILQSEFKCALHPCREFVCHLRFDARIAAMIGQESDVRIALQCQQIPLQWCESVVGTTLGVLSVLLNRLWRKERQHKPAFRVWSGSSVAIIERMRSPFVIRLWNWGDGYGVRRPGFGVGRNRPHSLIGRGHERDLGTQCGQMGIPAHVTHPPNTDLSRTPDQRSQSFAQSDTGSTAVIIPPR